MKSFVLSFLGLVLIAVLGGKVRAQQAEKAEVFVQMGHAIVCYDLSHDGRFIATGGWDNNIKLWDYQSGKLIRDFEGHHDRISHVTFSYDDLYLLSASRDSIKLWNVQEGNLIYTLKSEVTSIDKLLFCDNHTFFAVGPYKIQQWDFTSGKSIRLLTDTISNTGVTSVSRNGKYALTRDNKNVLKIRDVEQGKLIKKLKGHKNKVIHTSFLMDGKRVLTVDTLGFLITWDFLNEKKLTEFKLCSETDYFSLSSDETRGIFSAYQNKSCIAWLDLKHSGNCIERSSYTFSSDHDHLIKVSGDSLIVIDFLYEKKIKSIQGYKQSNNSYHLSSDHKQLMFLMNTGLRLWDIKNGCEISSNFIHKIERPLAAVFSSDGRYLYYIEDKSINEINIVNGKMTKSLKGHRGSVKSLCLSPDNRYLASIGYFDTTLIVWDISSSKDIFHFPFPSYWHSSKTVFSPDNKSIFVAWGDTIKRIDFISGPEKIYARTNAGWRSITDPFDDLYVTKDSKSVYGFINDRLYQWDYNTSQLIYQTDKAVKVNVVYKPVNIFDVSPDGKYYITLYNNDIILWDATTNQRLKEYRGHKHYISQLSFFDNENIISSSFDGTVILWNIHTLSPLMKFYSFNDNEWLCITPDGYFNCSPNGAKNINVRVGMNVYSIDNFFETYYRPDIVKARLAGVSTTEIVTADLTKNFKLPPQLNIHVLKTDGVYSELTTSETKDLQIKDNNIKVKIIATNSGGGIHGVRLFNNGKAVGENMRGFKKVQSENTFEQEFTVTLMEGENNIKAVGFSDDMTESNPVTAVVTYAAPKSAKPDMHILAIGINEYRNGKYNLNYCVDDMNGFVDVITPIAKKIFGNVKTTKITSREANRVNVLKALEDIKTKTKAEDVFVVFYAGHGIALDVQEDGKTRSEFFYVLSEVTQMTDPLKCSQDGLSGTEMRKLLSEIKAAKQVMFVDACNSGAFAAQFAVRGAAEENALAKLSRATGSVIYASTTKEQFATEFTELKHGAFTYVLIDALGGKASLANGQITVSSIKAFVDDQIPAITKKYKGEEQFPTTFIWGQDFPIGVK